MVALPLPQSPKPQMPQLECAAAPKEPWRETTVHCPLKYARLLRSLKTSHMNHNPIYQQLCTSTLPATPSSNFHYRMAVFYLFSSTVPCATELRGGHRLFLENSSKLSLSFSRPQRRNNMEFNVQWEMPPLIKPSTLLSSKLS